MVLPHTFPYVIHVHDLHYILLQEQSSRLGVFLSGAGGMGEAWGMEGAGGGAASPNAGCKYSCLVSLKMQSFHCSKASYMFLWKNHLQSYDPDEWNIPTFFRVQKLAR